MGSNKEFHLLIGGACMQQMWAVFLPTRAQFSPRALLQRLRLSSRQAPGAGADGPRAVSEARGWRMHTLVSLHSEQLPEVCSTEWSKGPQQDGDPFPTVVAARKHPVVASFSPTLTSLHPVGASRLTSHINYFYPKPPLGCPGGGPG